MSVADVGSHSLCTHGPRVTPASRHVKHTKVRPDGHGCTKQAQQRKHHAQGAQHGAQRGIFVYSARLAQFAYAHETRHFILTDSRNKTVEYAQPVPESKRFHSGQSVGNVATVASQSDRSGTVCRLQEERQSKDGAISDDVNRW